MRDPHGRTGWLPLPNLGDPAAHIAQRRAMDLPHLPEPTVEPPAAHPRRSPTRGCSDSPGAAHRAGGLRSPPRTRFSAARG